MNEPVNYASLSVTLPAATALRSRVIRQLQEGRHPYDGRLLSPEEVASLRERMLPAETLQSGITSDKRTWQELSRDRKTSDYWRSHCEKVGSMLSCLAFALGQDEQLWKITGQVHDFDFLLWPHYDNSTDSTRAHPTALSQELLELGMPPVCVLAVLEHSPHLGLQPTSLLSHALILCDEHATMTGYGLSPKYMNADHPLCRCLSSGDPIAGYVRSDMELRATSAYTAVTRFYDIGQAQHLDQPFNINGWKP